MSRPMSYLASHSLVARGLASVFALLAAASPAAARTEPAGARLEVVAQSPTMIWNAVAVDADRIFVAGPRWTGSAGPALGVIDALGKVRPYPDATWNAWSPGQDPARAFVNLNAIHLDGAGGLWAVDTGSPTFGGDPLPGGAKLVRIALASGKVDRVIALGPDIAKPGSYVDDIRFNGPTAYLTDAGQPGLIVLDLASGKARRVLENHPATVARDGRPIVLDGKVVKAPGGAPLKVNADPFELSPDGAFLYFAPLEGPWSRVPTRLLDDPAVPAQALAQSVEPWADLPPTGGTAMAPNGDLYFTDLAANAVRKRAADGTVSLVVQDPRLHWVDAPFLDADGDLWLPTPQMDRVALFQGGRSRTQWPVSLFRLRP